MFSNIAFVMHLYRIIGTNMLAVLIIALCALYSAHGYRRSENNSVQLTEIDYWNEHFNNLYILTQTGTVPSKYFPLTPDDKHATRKADAFVSFIKVVPQLNPLKLPSLEPYNVVLPDVNFQGELLLTDVVVAGIKDVVVPYLQLRMDPSRIDFNASAPYASAQVNFQLKATVGNQPLNVYGYVVVRLWDLLLSAAVGPKLAVVNSVQVYQLDSANAEINVNQLQVAVNMNQHSEEFRRILIQFLQNPEQYSGIVNDLLKAVLKAINHELLQITAQEILQYLLGSGRPNWTG